MITSQESLQKQHECHFGWFIGYGVALLFTLFWAFIGDSDWRIVFVTAAFIMFVRAGVNLETTSRCMHAEDAH